MQSIRTNPYCFEKLREAYDRLNDWRNPNRSRVTYQDIADGVGMKRVYVIKIIRGEKWYKPAVLKVAQFLGVSERQLTSKTKRSIRKSA